jgi:pimeloyl-ACP methyl ester carboxylesterase
MNKTILSVIVFLGVMPFNAYAHNFEYGNDIVQAVGYCESISDIEKDMGCVPYEDKSDLYSEYNGKRGGVVVKQYKNTSGERNLKKVIYIAAPFDLDLFDDDSSASTLVLESQLYMNDVYKYMDNDYPGYSYGSFLDGARDEGFDVLIFGWPDKLNDDYLQRKGYALSMAINWVQSEREKLGIDLESSYETLIGLSLGGVVARYALVNLENHFLNDIEAYVSFDSPHYGANIPVAIPKAIEYLKDAFKTAKRNNRNTSLKWLVSILDVFEDVTWFFGGQLLVESEIFNWDWDGDQYDGYLKDMERSLDSLDRASKELATFLDKKNTPAAKQLLINEYNEDYDLRDQLWKELDEMGFPKQSINITYVNSSIGFSDRIEMQDAYSSALFHLRNRTQHYFY